MARAVAEDSGAVLPVCAWVDGEYGISGVYLGVEAEIGVTGVRRVVECGPGKVLTGMGKRIVPDIEYVALNDAASLAAAAAQA